MDNDDEARDLIQALAGYLGLKKLVLGRVWIGRNGCAALKTLLQNKDSQLAVLESQRIVHGQWWMLLLFVCFWM